MATRAFKVADHVLVWSKSCGEWCPGAVQHVEGPLISVTYTIPNGQASMKQVLHDHGHLRHRFADSVQSSASASPLLQPQTHHQFLPPHRLQFQVASPSAVPALQWLQPQMQQQPSQFQAQPVLRSGARVRLGGLLQAAVYNGKLGVITEYISTEQRCIVKLDDGEDVFVKPENLVVDGIAQPQMEQRFALQQQLRSPAARPRSLGASLRGDRAALDGSHSDIRVGTFTKPNGQPAMTQLPRNHDHLQQKKPAVHPKLRSGARARSEDCRPACAYIGHSRGIMEPISIGQWSKVKLDHGQDVFVKPDNVQLDSTYSIGQLVERRNQGENWKAGYITCVDPLRVSFDLKDRGGLGWQWDEVRSIQVAHEDRFRKMALVQTNDALVGNVQALLRAALFEKARNGQLMRILSAIRLTAASSAKKDEAHNENVRMALRKRLAEKAGTAELRVILSRRFPRNSHKWPTYAIGQLVERRNQGEHWKAGYITCIDPLRVSFDIINREGLGWKWDEVRPVQAAPEERFGKIAIVRTKDGRVENVQALLRAALSEKARNGQLTRILSARCLALNQDKAARPASLAQVGVNRTGTNSSNKDEAHYENVRTALRRNLAEKVCTAELRSILRRHVSAN